MIVSVIVDIPAAQVNHTFDYRVSPSMTSIIQLGTRIQVPFGNRQLMAYVVAIHEDSQFKGELKTVTSVIDYDAYLNEELIALSDHLSQHLQAFRISILQTMLPSLLKVRYSNYIKVKDFDRMQGFLREYGSNLSFDEEKRYPIEAFNCNFKLDQVKYLLDQRIIEVIYQLENKARPKLITYIQPLISQADLEEIKNQLPKRSHKLREFADFILTMKGPILRKDLLHMPQVSPYLLKKAIALGWLGESEQETYRDPDAGKLFQPSAKKVLNPAQEKVYQTIANEITQRKAQTFLLEGVTGSGKTEVYLQLMAKAQENNQSALLLVPEIALTPQMVRQVKQRFQSGVAVIHSGLSLSEKFDEWRRITKGEATIVVGARSSIFAPLRNLGIIIIDEEHESSYKQSENPRYHARDVAIWRSHYHQCPVLLGSATPSLESRARAQVGHYHYVCLPDRVNQNPLPAVELIDMRQIVEQASLNPLSPQLREAIKQRLNKHEQVVLLLNRRGYANYIMCRECGTVCKCPKCDIALTYHKHDHKMKCHYCDYTSQLPQICPQCGSQHLRAFGSGTQKVEESLKAYFPDARVLRMDVDTTHKKGAHEAILDQFAHHQADILLGTQMIAKGLDFENVTLVGVINADTALNLPDFRASERTFQLLTQVAGRAGRGRLAGQVLIQTYNPDHYVIQLAKTHDYERFFLYEMKRRHLAAYPPYYYMTLVTITSKNEAQAIKTSYEIMQQFTPLQSKDLVILGPNQANIAKINETYYYQLLLKYKSVNDIRTHLETLAQLGQTIQKKGIHIAIDHEPLFF